MSSPTARATPGLARGFSISSVSWRPCRTSSRSRATSRTKALRTSSAPRGRTTSTCADWSSDTVGMLLVAHLLVQDTVVTSFLKTVDVASGRIDTIYRETRHFEAPNWSPDGRFFLLNSDGRLYRLDIATTRLELLPIEFVTPRMNNDHGISPDGKWLVVSHEPTEDWLTSSIYLVPISGGTPKQITTRAPSFWHGWSPDGKTLAYVGRRGPDNEFDIYTIPVTGGEEKRLTTCRGLDDGPDYSPDGAFIYYNSF